jgi:hypothetical protein
VSEPERAPVVDVGARVDQLVGELVAAGFEDSDARGDGGGRLDPGGQGDGRL